MDSYQSENALFKEDSLSVIEKYDENNLDIFCNSERFIFGNRGKAIAEDDIDKQSHSLMFVKTTNFEAYQRSYGDNPKPQARMKFTYAGIPYDLPVTDPVFLKKYRYNPEFVDDYTLIYMTMSISREHKNWYYKLVAGIILL
jgi:hypothetical protein